MRSLSLDIDFFPLLVGDNLILDKGETHVKLTRNSYQIKFY